MLHTEAELGWWFFFEAISRRKGEIEMVEMVEMPLGNVGR